jgi:DNA repair protein RadC
MVVSQGKKNNSKKGSRMTTATQTDLFPQTQKPAKTKTYSVQKYRLTYVKERSNFNRIRINHRADVMDFCKQYLSPLPIENVCIIALDNVNSIIGYEALEGATNQCAVYPTNVFRFLLTSGATSFIIAHNHPGGSTRASEADWTLTARLKKVGDLLELPLLDHLIITETDCVSLKDNSRWSKD